MFDGFLYERVERGVKDRGERGEEGNMGRETGGRRSDGAKE